MTVAAVVEGNRRYRIHCWNSGETKPWDTGSRISDERPTNVVASRTRHMFHLDRAAEWSDGKLTKISASATHNRLPPQNNFGCGGLRHWASDRLRRSVNASDRRCISEFSSRIRPSRGVVLPPEPQRSICDVRSITGVASKGAARPRKL